MYIRSEPVLKIVGNILLKYLQTRSTFSSWNLPSNLSKFWFINRGLELQSLGWSARSNNLNWFLNFNQIYKTLDWGEKWLVDFNAGKTQLVLFDWSNNTCSLLMFVKMDGSVLEERSSFKMLGLTFYSKLDWGFLLSLLLKLPPTKLEP